MRLARTLRIEFSHVWIFQRGRAAGLDHLSIFYGFGVLFLGTAMAPHLPAGANSH